MRKTLKDRGAVLAVACALVLSAPCVAFAAGTTPGTASDQKAETASAATDSADGEKAAGPRDELLAWAEGMPCEACHEVPAASLEDEKCPASLHAALSVRCIDCHADDALIDIHGNAKADAKVPMKLKKSQLSIDTCYTCHPRDMLIEKTAESKALVDSEGTVVNPHEIPDVKDHRKINCGSCHTMHSDSSPVSKAPGLCQDCHHEDVYECYTCHS